MADRAAVEAMVRTAEAELGPVSLLVNNAGIAGQIQFQDITDAQWNRYLGVNLGGARNTIQAVLPHMLHEKAGCIVNISSIWGLRGASCEVAYACTKAALVGLTRSLALELAPSHIRVNCVAPGVINTDMVQVLGQETLRDLAEQTPLGRLGTPEDVAHAVAFLASDKASLPHGANPRRRRRVHRLKTAEQEAGRRIGGARLSVTSAPAAAARGGSPGRSRRASGRCRR